MASPELRPGLLPLLQTEDEELCWPEDSPRAVCEVARNVLVICAEWTILYQDSTYSMQYAFFHPKLCWM
jgi:hypothetical protein